MWLLNAETRKLEAFMDDRQVRGKYAILSHTWEKEEVLFDEIELADAKNKAGYRKIDFTCRQALEDGLEYVWVDTCCIDKKSSAELSEAINSMYRWYYNASICYAYLSDLSPAAWSESRYVQLERIGSCRWFSRGWTLQELIAPEVVRFFDRDWSIVLEKFKTSSDIAALARITSIGPSVLRDREFCSQTSIASRLSWASRRRTTRVEDEAYSLIGLLNINMPLLYGEGERAFIRLQEEAIRTWSRVDHSLLLHYGNGLLAQSAADFLWLRSRTVHSWALPERETFELTNVGLRITVLTDDRSQKSHSADVTVALNCCNQHAPMSQMKLTLRRRPQLRRNTLDHQVTSDTEILDWVPGISYASVDQLDHFVRKEVLIARKPFEWPQELSTIELRPGNFRVRSEHSRLVPSVDTTGTRMLEREVYHWESPDVCTHPLVDERDPGELERMYRLTIREKTPDGRREDEFPRSSSDNPNKVLQVLSHHLNEKRLRKMVVTITSERSKAAGHTELELHLVCMRNGPDHSFDRLCGATVMLLPKTASSTRSDPPSSSNPNQSSHNPPPTDHDPYNLVTARYHGRLCNGRTTTLSLKGHKLVKIEANLTASAGGITWSLRLHDADDTEDDAVSESGLESGLVRRSGSSPPLFLGTASAPRC